MKSFIILSYGHSGTSCLNDILKQSHIISVYGEIFNRKYDYNKFVYSDKVINSKDIEAYVNEFLNYNHKTEFIGCNLHFPHIDFFNKTDIVELITRKFEKVIILKRNPIMVFFAGRENIHLEIKKFEEFINCYHKNYEWCERIPNSLIVKSEDIFYKDVETINCICKYLDIEMFKFKNYSKMQHSNKFEERIQNYKEVKDYLISKGFA